MPIRAARKAAQGGKKGCKRKEGIQGVDMPFPKRRRGDTFQSEHEGKGIMPRRINLAPNTKLAAKFPHLVARP